MTSVAIRPSVEDADAVDHILHALRQRDCASGCEHGRVDVRPEQRCPVDLPRAFHPVLDEHADRCVAEVGFRTISCLGADEDQQGDSLGRETSDLDGARSADRVADEHQWTRSGEVEDRLCPCLDRVAESVQVRCDHQVVVDAGGVRVLSPDPSIERQGMEEHGRHPATVDRAMFHVEHLGRGSRVAPWSRSDLTARLVRCRWVWRPRRVRVFHVKRLGRGSRFAPWSRRLGREIREMLRLAPRGVRVVHVKRLGRGSRVAPWRGRALAARFVRCCGWHHGGTRVSRETPRARHPRRTVVAAAWARDS
jgi:hypothetical protein